MFKKRMKVLPLIAVFALLLGAIAFAPASMAQDLPEITYSFPGGTPTDLQAVQDAINAIVAPQIGATVKINPIDWGSYDQKMKLAFAAGETCDAVFTAQWINNYNQNITNGNLMALDDLLPSVTPKLWASLAPVVWDGTKVNGKIYQVVSELMWAKNFGFYVRKDMAEKYKLDVNSIKTYADLQPFLDQIKQNEPDMVPAYLEQQAFGEVNLVNIAGYDGSIDGNGGAFGVIKADDKDLKVLPAAFIPEYQQSVELQRQFYNAGYFPHDLLSRDDTDAEMRAGKFAVQMTRVIKPGSESEESGLYGGDWIGKGLATNYYVTTDSVTAGFGICATSQHPNETLKFLELLHTNQDVYNLLAHGIEGKHWEFVDKANKVIGFPAGVTAANSPYNPAQGWMWGNQFLEYYLSPAQIGTWEATKKINDASVGSTALGFTLNPDPIKNELAALSAVHSQYGLPLETGLVDPATALPEYQQKLKDAGLDTVITEIQKQLDAWKAGQAS